MSVSSGFFNSVKGDRKYNAEQMSAIFDGIINDGVFASVGTAFAVNATTGNIIQVGIGRAWFNSTWIYNDAVLSITADDSDILLDRYDALVIEVDRTDAVRMASVKFKMGTAASTPQYPTLTKSTNVNQYPLAYIYRKAGSTAIAQSDITNCIGTSSCPYVTGILEVQNIDKIVAQWESEFDDWFSGIKISLEGDVAASLTNKVAELEAKAASNRHFYNYEQYNPTNTGYNTLLEFINGFLVPNNHFHATFHVSSFTDLPKMDWGFTVEYIQAGTRYCKLFRHLSGTEYYIREIGANGAWLTDWTLIRDGGNADTVDGHHAVDFLTVNGTVERYNPVSNLNDFFTGVALFNNATNSPFEWALILSAGTTGTVTQIAFDLFNNNSFKWRCCTGGTWNAWGTPKTNCLSLNSGGTVTGRINVQDANNGYGCLYKNNSDTSDYGTRLVDVNRSGAAIDLILSANSNAVFFKDSNDGQYEMLHRNNSSAVKIQESQPDDTSALWVW